MIASAITSSGSAIKKRILTAKSWRKGIWTCEVRARPCRTERRSRGNQVTRVVRNARSAKQRVKGKTPFKHITNSFVAELIRFCAAWIKEAVQSIQIIYRIISRSRRAEPNEAAYASGRRSVGYRPRR